MRKTRLFSMLTVLAIVILYSSVGLSENSHVISLSTGGRNYNFVPQPHLGYVMKSSRNQSAIALLQNSLPGTQSNEKRFLEIENRDELAIVLEKSPSVQNQNNINMPSGQADIEYSSPLYTLDGQTVAVIPEIIARLIDKSDYDKLEDICQKLDCTIVKKLFYTEQEFQIASKARTGEEVLKIAEEFSSEDFIEWAFPNLAFQPQLSSQPNEDEPNRIEPNDVYFNDEWHLNKIKAPDAWAYTTGDPNIIVAVLDDGVEINHPDLAANIWTNIKEIPGNGIDDDNNGQKDDIHGWDFYYNRNNVNPESADAHGTACAGLIAAKGNNDLGVTGVAWNCTIMPVRISRLDNFITDTAIATAFRYAAKSGADILSNSWIAIIDVPIIYSAIKDVTQANGIGRNGKGCLVFFASGNWLGGGPILYPANYPEVISIGAINQNDVVWSYSASGPELDLVAPSGNTSLKGDIWTTDITGQAGYNNRDPRILDYTDRMGGTSAACPIAAGVAALVLSADPNLTNYDVEGILSNSARDLGPTGWDEKYGYGCVNACESVFRVMYPRKLNIFVDDNSPDDPEPGNPTVSDPLEDGSIEHPFDSINKALDYAVYKDTITVLPGTYTGNGNYNIDFSGKAVTVHSRDGAGTCTIDCQNNGRAFSFQRQEGEHSIIDGFTIIDGNADKGGGINILYSSPTILNCVFSGNTAGLGGGISSTNSSSAIRYCVFMGNYTNYNGAGIYNNSSSIAISHCSFTGNTAAGYGGGIYSDKGSLFLENVSFTGNSALNGGGIYCNTCTSSLKYCTYIENSADGYGGGINNSKGNLTASGCVFSGNTGRLDRGAIYNLSGLNYITNCTFYENTGGICQSGNSCNIINCILWNNSQELSGTIYKQYSNVNDTDPLFADPENGDFHLKSQVGRWDPINRVWVQDDVTSPCIDSGDPTYSVDDETWPHGKKINMGAYGGTTQASLSPSNAGDIRDLNNNNTITWEDVLLLIDKWHSTDAPVKGDLDKNGIVDVNDLAYFYGNWSDSSNNIVPVLDFFGDQYVTVGSELSYSITAFDGDNGMLTYSAAGLPEGAEFEGQFFSWTPQESATFFVTFLVTDNKSLDYMTVKIVVDEE